MVVVVAAAVLSGFTRGWLQPILESVVDGDRSRGGRVGFTVGVASLTTATLLWAAAGGATTRRVGGGTAGWVLRVAAVLALSVFSVGFTGRGPLTGSERVFDRAVPGYQGGTAVAFGVAFIVGLPLYIGVWSWYDTKRRRAAGLPVADEHPAMAAVHTFTVITLVTLAVALIGVLLAAVIFGLVALFD